MASTDDSGIRLWDLAAVREWDKPAGLLAVGHCSSAFFDRRGDSLITAGAGAGLQRWPIVRKGERLKIGPPQTIATSPRVPRQVVHRNGALSLDGRTVAFLPNTGAGLVLDLSDPKRKTALLGYDLEELQLSPDGKWVVGHGFHNRETPVWDSRSGELVKLLPQQGRCNPRFSPDGRWLTIGMTSGETRFWEVGTWQAAQAVQPKELNIHAAVLAFTRDGKMAAVLHNPSRVIQLIDPVTGHEFATLEPADPQHHTSLCFSPDGSQLAVACVTHVLQVWDLRLIREQLTAMGLDWDSPPYPPLAESKNTSPLKVEVDLGELAKPTPTPTSAGRARQAIDYGRRAVQAKPNDAMACNELAWTYATAPEALRDIKEALCLARKAVELEPKNPIFGNTLGVVYYRAGKYRQAADALRTNLKIAEDRFLAFDLYILAMSYQQLGERERAREYFDWEVRWSRTQKKTRVANSTGVPVPPASSDT